MKKETIVIIIGLITISIISAFTISNIQNFSTSISQLDEEIQKLQSQLNTKETLLGGINSQLSQKQYELNQKEYDLDKTNNTVEKLNSGDRYLLHDPAYYEARNFIRSDKTNTRTYDEDTFNCAHYAQEVNNNAEKEGLRCAHVTVNLSEGAPHALIAFNTTDRGIIYFEPQSDEKVNLEVGKDYWADCVVPPPGYYYKSDPGWIIQDFIIYW